MSKERILETIGQVNDEYIIEAAPKGLLEGKVPEVNSKAKLYRFARWGALAACLCLIAGLSMQTNLFTAKKNDASFEMENGMMNQSAETESVTEESKTDFNTSLKNNADTEYSTGSYATGADGGSVTAETPASAERIETDGLKEDRGFPDWGLTLSVKNVTSAGLIPSDCFGGRHMENSGRTSASGRSRRKGMEQYCLFASKGRNQGV